MKKTLITLSTTLGALAVVTTATYAIGTLTPSGTAGDDTYYTLNDIYAKITADTDATVGSGTMTVPGTQTASFYTLTEIYEALPDWKTLSAATTTVAAGYYEATDLATVDTDLTAGNIKDGTTIFGVEGTVEEGSAELTWSTNHPDLDWDTAVSICSGTVDGSTGWRLPTIDELSKQILYDYITEGDLSSSLFDFNATYWTSTVDGPSDAYFAYWDGGFVEGNYDMKELFANVRCVK
jgi:hypothetical protein